MDQTAEDKQWIAAQELASEIIREQGTGPRTIASAKAARLKDGSIGARVRGIDHLDATERHLGGGGGAS
jgi:hypothetical protein